MQEGSTAKPSHHSTLLGPKRQPLPFPLVWLVIASLSAVTVLTVAHTILLSSTAGDRSARARRLLQRGRGAASAVGLSQPHAHDGTSLHVEHAPAEIGGQHRLPPLRRDYSSSQEGATSSGESQAQASNSGGGNGDAREWGASSSRQQNEGDSGSSGGSSTSGGSSGHSDVGGRSQERVQHSSGGSGSSQPDLLEALVPEGGSSASASAVERLTEGTDLATFAAPGTHCVITPSHGKVALLFLTHGDLPHADLWADWMREAAGLLPRDSLSGPQAFCLKQCDAAGSCELQCGPAAACNPLCVDALRRRLGPSRSPSVLAQQHLFSVYVHARPTLKDYPDGSVFQGRLIPDRLTAKWGTHALAAAAKRLVEVAVLDGSNQRFVLVGDTTVPLYHPALMWQQLMRESRSRLDACWHQDGVLMRRRCNPQAMSSARFRPALHWRKSSQWFALNRKHAELVAADREVESLFARHCHVGWDQQLRRHRDCISDEHYLPSLLAMYGLDNETTCDFTGGTYASWEQAADTREGGHPKLFHPGHITPELIAGIRAAPGHPLGVPTSEEERASCAGWAAASRAAVAALVNVSSVTLDSCPTTLGSGQWLQEDPFAGAALGPRCVLLARKFSKPAAKWVHELYRSCTADMGVLLCSQTLTDRDKNWWR